MRNVDSKSRETVQPHLLFMHATTDVVPEQVAVGTHVWLGPMETEAVQLDAALQVLTVEEQARARNIRHPDARVQAITGRARLRGLLAKLLDCPPTEVLIHVRADGKPVLHGVAPAWYFNLSHTSQFWAVAISTCDVGIDLELIRPMPGADALVLRYFSEGEHAQYLALPDNLKLEAFFRGWTMKEAILKGIGCGIRGLETCRINLDPREAPTIVGNASVQAAWQVETCRPYENHLLSVAVNTAVPLCWSHRHT